MVNTGDHSSDYVAAELQKRIQNELDFCLLLVLLSPMLLHILKAPVDHEYSFIVLKVSNTLMKSFNAQYKCHVNINSDKHVADASRS